MKKSNKIQAMFDGLGIDPKEIIEIADQQIDHDYAINAESPFPSLSRYHKYISFMDDLTSMKALYKYRIAIIVEYFITLADTMSGYSGMFANKKIIQGSIADDMRKALRSIADGLTYQQMMQIEAIEAKSDHDTAAITDWIKFTVDQANIISDDISLDGFHFGRTSEDVNSPVFALMNRDLFFRHVIPEIILLQESVITYAREYSHVTAGLTHGQPAEPTTISKQLANIVASIDSILRKSFLANGAISFPVKTFGAVGNHSDLRAAYPDIDWIENDRRFVAALGPGLHLDMMTTQASLYGEYKLIYDALCTISRLIIKFVNDFWGWTSFQWFKRKKKTGVKGSSVMPNKYNPWRMEGAKKILEKFIIQLEYTSKALMDYPYEGDMGRSIIMRDIGDDFAKFFIAMGRIREELGLYELNIQKIEDFLKNNPGLLGGAAQTILKRDRAEGDAYRRIQQIMINSDGTYISQEEFIRRMEEEPIPEQTKKDILYLTAPEKNTGYADDLAAIAIEKAEETIRDLRNFYAK